MFSYLRPHRRTPSNPSSPLPPDSSHSWESQNPSDTHPFPASKDANIPAARPQSASASPKSLPTLPPIARVSSFSSSIDSRNEAPELDSRQTWQPRATSQSPEPPTVDSQQWGQNQPPKRPDTAGSTGSSRYTGLGTSWQSSFPTERRPSAGPLPFVTAADLQSSFALTGRKATGARMSTPPPVSKFEGTQPRSGKRLNLLNPMSLLARRRTSQPAPQLAPIQNIPNPRVQDGFDPRIRGTKVHDFSAPRQSPSPIVSYNDAHDLENSDSVKARYQRYSGGQYAERTAKLVKESELSPWSGGSHTAVFTEDFDEEQYPASGPNVRKANDVLDLPLPRPPYAKGSAKPKEISKWVGDVEASPPAGQNFQGQSNTQTSGALMPAVASKYHFQNSEPPKEVKINEDSTLASSETSRKSSSSTLRNRSRHVSDASFHDGAFYPVPKHMKSNSSRFSFDMLGAAGQEKLLEDRHRQRALEKAAHGQGDGQNKHDSFEEDSYDYDDLDDDDGLEERIPGVNAEADDESFEDEMPLGTNGMSGFTFHPMNISVTASPAGPLSPKTVATPRDTNGEIIGFAMTKESPYLTQDKNRELGDPLNSQNLETRNAQERPTGPQLSGLGLHGVNVDGHKMQSVQSAAAVSTSSRPADADDDLYFDDGLIEHVEEDVDGPEFDESVFDNDDTDEYGRPLRPLSSLPTLYSPPVISDSRFAGNDRTSNVDSGSVPHEAIEQAAPGKFRSIEGNTLTLDVNGQGPNKTAGASADVRPAASLTHDTLNAYQSALAAAAHNAAANGRFRRDSTPTTDFDERLESDLPEKMSPLYSPDLKDDFDYDDALEDDLIIAEANAEALANDNDGFYGQEFGFYSAPTAGEAQAVNGGFFGPRGADVLTRSQSGRAAQREPNLTPITERSEYSNRNSAMSTGFGFGSAPPSATFNNPGLAQLAGMMGDRDDDKISLDALLKLRRGAWGSSQVSAPSSNAGGSPLIAVPVDESNPSPSSQLSPWSQPPSFGHGRQNSNLSLSEGTRSESSSPNSPSLALAKLNSNPHAKSSPHLPFAPPAPSPALIASFNQRAPLPPAVNISSAIGLVSPTNESFDKENGFVPGRGEVKRHRHTISSDSISYMQEDDPVTGQRWVLERRRMSETGEMEILGRQVLGGRI